MIRLELTPYLFIRSELFGVGFAREAKRDLENTLQDLKTKAGEHDPVSVLFILSRRGVGFGCFALHPNTRWGRELLKTCLPVESEWTKWPLLSSLYEGERAVPLGEKWAVKMRWHSKGSYRKACAELERRMANGVLRNSGALLDIDLRTALVSVGAGISIAEGLARVEKAFDVWGDGPLTGLGFEKYRDRSFDSLFVTVGAGILAATAFLAFMGGR